MPEVNMTRAPHKLLEHIEDDTAILLSGREAIVELELFARRMHRRGYVGDDEMREIETWLTRASRALNHQLDYTRHIRANPKEAIGE